MFRISTTLIIDEISSTKGLATAYTSLSSFLFHSILILFLDRRKNYMGFISYSSGGDLVLVLHHYLLLFFYFITHFSGFDFA